ncbi:hypothetical protein K4K49_012163 [Colletotrichum sp. SAR 10_70]|nr:hypothetical protein K4K50_011246 [Colletotrichum sp. SAR 10_71]KAI8190678.1 hypothetical protein K4K49_012163 [Colletotrichum sp. SAR 10_70]
MDTARLTEANISILPSELHNAIGDFLDDTHDLSNLARINQTFYRVFNRLLYEAAVKDHHPGPTIEAASKGNLGALKLAAEHGANLDYHQLKPLTAEEIAAKDIRYRLSPRARWGAPLHFAIIYGHQHIVEWLISKGVDIEAPARLYCGCEDPYDIVDYHRCFRDRYDSTDWGYDKFPIYIAFRMHHASAAFKLVECGTPIWSREEVWDYEIDTDEQVEKPIALLTEVLAGWDDEWSRTNTRLCGLTDKCCHHKEQEIAAKKNAFLKLAQRTVNEVPHEVSINELKDILARGLIAMVDHADFCDEDFSEFIKIIKPALNEDAIEEFRQSVLSLLVDHKTRDYEFAQMRGITFLLDDQWFGEPIIHVDNRLMKRTLDTVVREIPWLDDDDHVILTNMDCLIRTMELLRVHGAWKDAREQTGRISTEEKSSWTLAGTTVEGEKCSELSGQWNKLRSDELKIIPSKFRHIFTKVRWGS